MVEQDTIRLLRECDAGVKMGVSSIEDVLEYVRSKELKKLLEDCRAEHEKLKTEIQKLIEKNIIFTIGSIDDLSVLEDFHFVYRED